MPASAERPAIAFVPLDDRPVTLQLPVMLGAIAGIDVRTPPRALVGRYLDPGSPDAILAWLGADDNGDSQVHHVAAQNEIPKAFEQDFLLS